MCIVLFFSYLGFVLLDFPSFFKEVILKVYDKNIF